MILDAIQHELGRAFGFRWRDPEEMLRPLKLSDEYIICDELLIDVQDSNLRVLWRNDGKRLVVELADPLSLEKLNKWVREQVVRNR